MIGRDQLLDAGLSERAVDERVRRGAYIRRHRGVYDIAGAAIGMRGRGFAALLAGRDGSTLSHRFGAAHWLLLPEPPVPEITVPDRHIRSRADLIVHRSTTLSAADITERAGLRVTSVLRTLLDLATVETSVALERAVAEARVLQLLDPAEARAAAGRHPGARRLLAALDGDESAPTQSELERAMVRLIRDAKLPPARPGMVIAGHRADFAWPEHRLIVEVDGWSAHGHRVAFERDRARDVAHAVVGWTVVRFTARQVGERPLEVTARLAALLSVRRPAT